MSNGLFDYNLEQQSTLLAQHTQVGRFINERNRPFSTISHCLQAIIAEDSVVSITPKVILDAEGGKIFHVVSYFDSVPQAIKAGKYNRRIGFADAQKIAQVPMIIQPVDRMVKATPLLPNLRTRHLFRHYPKMADPMTLLTLGFCCPEEQYEAPIFVVWKDHTGQLWRAMLYSKGDDRHVEFDKENPDSGWGDVRVLTCE